MYGNMRQILIGGDQISSYRSDGGKIFALFGFFGASSKFAVLAHLTIKKADRPHPRDHSTHRQGHRSNGSAMRVLRTDGQTDGQTDATKYIISLASRSIITIYR